MTDTSVFLFINGLAGKIPVIDQFFKGLSNDYFSLVLACLVLVWLWFSTRDGVQREINQRAAITAIISVGLASIVMVVINAHYFRERPFNALSAGSVNLLFYRPHDSSLPSNFAAVMSALALPVFFKNKAYGSFLLALTVIASFGRIYMGVHYPLDILAGFAVGALGSLAAYIVSRVLSPLLTFVLNTVQRIYLA